MAEIKQLKRIRNLYLSGYLCYLQEKAETQVSIKKIDLNYIQALEYGLAKIMENKNNSTQEKEDGEKDDSKKEKEKEMQKHLLELNKKYSHELYDDRGKSFLILFWILVCIAIIWGVFLILFFCCSSTFARCLFGFSLL